MENNENGQQVVLVKNDEIEKLTELGFQNGGDIVVLETETGAIGVDKETGIVATFSDGVSIEELAIVTDLVSNGIAEIVNATDFEIDDLKEELKYDQGE